MTRSPPSLFFGSLLALSAVAGAPAWAECPEVAEEDDCADEDYSPITGEDSRGIDTLYRHGVRMGYSYVNLQDNPLDIDPHMFVMGYEVNQVFEGGGPVDFLMTYNVVVTGLNQSLFVPTANLLTGVEIGNRVQLGAGPNVSLGDPSGNDRLLHMIMAIGYTPQVGDLSLPVHVSYIPDVDGYYRAAVTTGVNW